MALDLSSEHAPALPNGRRSAAALRALRRFALIWAWDQAYHVASCYRPGTVNIPAKARELLKQGLVEAKSAETSARHGREAAHPLG